MKLLYVTAELPYGHGEAFLIPEIDELLRLNCDVCIVPRDARGSVVHNDTQNIMDCCVAERMISLRVLGGAMLEGLRRPIHALRALATLFRSRDLKTLAKNLA